MNKIRCVLAVLGMLVLAQGSYAQQREARYPGVVLPDDSVEMQKQIRRAKFDTVLPRVLRDNNIDMWIYVMRSWTPDPFRFEFGASEGVFIFTDRGKDRIERAAFAGGVQDPDAYDIVVEEGMQREQQPGTPTEMDIRFVGLQEFVAERDPKRIGVNYIDDLSVASSTNYRSLTDGISHKDYNLLIEALGEKYAGRVHSGEYVLVDYVAGRVKEEIELYTQWGRIAAHMLDGEFAKVVPGVTKLSDLDGNVFRRNPDGREFHADDPDPYVLQRGDLFTILNGAHGRNFYGEVSGNAYLLKEGEIEAPPEIKEVWKHAMKVREILKENIKAGRTAGDTLDLLIRKIEEAGYFYNPVDYWDKDADQQKTQIHLDCHAVGRNEFVGPRISPFGPDWLRNMKIPVLHTFTFEYMVHMPVPKWGKGKHLYIAFHDGAVVTEDGVVFPYPPDQGIRIIR